MLYLFLYLYLHLATVFLCIGFLLKQTSFTFKSCKVALEVTGDRLKSQRPRRKRNPPVFLARDSVMIHVAYLGPFHHL